MFDFINFFIKNYLTIYFKNINSYNSAYIIDLFIKILKIKEMKINTM